MSLMPVKTGVSDVYPNPDNATANAAFGAFWQAMYEASEKPELDVASAATVNIGGQLSTKLRITGTTGITSFGTTYRGPILIRFAAAVSITHNATTLILPGGANLTTSAGGTMIAYPKATAGVADGWIVAFSSDYVGIGAGGVASNTAYGKSALAANTTGDKNVAIGLSALTANDTGTQNTAVGWTTLAANTSGGANTAIGVNALHFNTTGGNNTAVGVNALSINNTGSNTAVGVNALVTATGGTNTAVGSSAGSTITSGANNTLIGYLAAPSAVGVSNEFTLGNSSIATLRCQVTSITALSDARDKTGITPLRAGLDFVQRLKPVSYVWNMRDGGKIGIPDTGFIAQELRQVQIDTGIDIPGLVYEENPERLEAAYGKLIPVLVKAIQDLSDDLDVLKSQLNQPI